MHNCCLQEQITNHNKCGRWCVTQTTAEMRNFSGRRARVIRGCLLACFSFFITGQAGVCVRGGGNLGRRIGLASAFGGCTVALVDRRATRLPLEPALAFARAVALSNRSDVLTAIQTHYRAWGRCAAGFADAVTLGHGERQAAQLLAVHSRVLTPTLPNSVEVPV